MTTAATATTTTPDTLSLVLTVKDAERLLALVDAENSATKNWLVAAVRSERHEDAVRYADDSAYLTQLRSGISHRIRNTLAR